MIVAGKKAKVLWDYNAQDQDEVTLKRGDIVNVLGDSEFDGWWKVQLGQKIGAFPSDYVKLINKKETAVETEQIRSGLS